MTEYLSDLYIIKTIALLKADYAIVTGIAIAVLAIAVKKTKTKLDDKAFSWLKGKLS